MAEKIRENLKKIQFAKVSPMEPRATIHYSKAISIKSTRCPSELFRAKMGYQMTSLQFLTTVPPTMSDLTLKPREKDRPVAAKSEGELAFFEIPKTRSTEDASDMCSGDYNTSCVDEIKKDLEKRRKKKPLQKMIDRMKHNKLHPE